MCAIAKTGSVVKRRRGRAKKRGRESIKGDSKKYELTEDMAQDRKYWMTQIMADLYKEVAEKGAKREVISKNAAHLMEGTWHQ